MSDVEKRASDYERRLKEAGGPDGVLSGLVEQFTKFKRLQFIMISTLFIDLTLSFAAIIFTYFSYTLSHKVDKNYDLIRANCQGRFEYESVLQNSLIADSNLYYKQWQINKDLYPSYVAQAETLLPKQKEIFLKGSQDIITALEKSYLAKKIASEKPVINECVRNDS